MLSTSATFNLNASGVSRNLVVTPLFLQNHNQPWQPNEIYEIQQTFNFPANELNKVIEPLNLGKIIVDEQMNWHYEGEHQLSEEEVEQIAKFVLSQI
ncbi:hypothetical protein BDD43_5313 [Mucilaginibacter gracilis]|uniref:Uncharacterized protein n=1 Tax=Mucilaginibacter gracilis TaxID=423350 RepID=A0A495J851_9SPHI|nr:hypothetical protein [Mucilaginibacter gracilis]RKR85057.1 hypothetical protein BDD43_5313 [Mucilaginibacter gracilis]